MNKLPSDPRIIADADDELQDATPLTNTPQLLPLAEWMDNPAAWNKAKFFNETAAFMYSVYGIGCAQDRHLLAMLADQMETYIDCTSKITADNLLTEQNDGKTIGTNPWVSIREKTLMRIVALMNELGLTPKNRLAVNKLNPQTNLSKFLKGPMA